APPPPDAAPPPPPDAAPPPPDAPPAGPVILSFDRNVTALTQGQAVRFVALLPHPNGLNNLVGGRLTDPTRTLSYGAFQASTQSSYSLDVSWDDFNQVQAITFLDSAQRTVVGEFFDVAGNKASQSLTIQFTCNGINACSGQCVDM